tara:strand:- start:10406 stop:10564 length:159 start_codon:yes stop_codon:yes gene_type:complete
MRLELEIQTIGDFEEKDLIRFIEWQLEGGSIQNDNPFIKDTGGAEIVRVDVS